MVEGLRARGVLRTRLVDDAMASVPRHLFVDAADVDIDHAYADVAIVVKIDAEGTAISSASQPTIVAAMLELSRLERGHRVLEIGTGTGYNAALLDHIVGPDGSVVSVELDADLAAAARDRLRRQGCDRVRVVTGDGAAGHLPGAPYDRVIVTTGAPDIAPAWIDQLRVGGRLVSPVVGADGVGVIRRVIKNRDGLDDRAGAPCGFLPMRS